MQIQQRVQLKSIACSLCGFKKTNEEHTGRKHTRGLQAANKFVLKGVLLTFVK